MVTKLTFSEFVIQHSKQLRMDPFISSLTFVLSIFCCIFLITLWGIFDNVELEIGLEHYAEFPWIPYFDFMPLNTLINFFYTGLGVYWCAFTNTASTHGVLKGHDVHLFYAFNIWAALYGLVQLARIVTQGVIWSVLDQWCTYPFFMCLLIWGLYYQYGWSNRHCMYLIIFSLSSYILTLISRIGFEIGLGFHMIIALAGGFLAYFKHPSSGSLISLYAAMVCCSGFVFLKLLDLKLASLSFIFRYVSGHFLSKICDVYQIHFVNAFFFDLAMQKGVDKSVQDKKKWILKDKQRRKVTGNDVPYENPVTLRAKKL